MQHKTPRARGQTEQMQSEAAYLGGGLHSVVALRLLQRRRQRAHPAAHVRRQRQVLHLRCGARNNAHRVGDDLHQADLVA